MKFSSFLLFTAAGLAIAAPITPVSPSNLEKKLTVEPVAVVKRDLPNAGSLGALTGAVPGGLPVGKRQLGGLIPSSSSTDDDSSESAESKEPKIPKEPKAPSSVTDGTTEIDDGTAESSTSSATSALSGLPIGKRGGAGGLEEVSKRQLDGVTGILSPKPADPPAAEEAPASEDAADNDSKGSDASEDAPAEETPEAPAAGEGEEDAPPADEESALAGILKRQLDGLTKGLFPTPDPAEPAADEAEEDTTTIKGQTNKADDGTNGANSFDAAEKAGAEKTTEEAAPAEAAPAADAKTAEEAAPAAKNATEPATAPAKKQGLAGLLGM